MVNLNWFYEEWRDIPGFKGRYQASSFGRIRCLDHYASGKNKSQRLLKEKVKKPQLVGKYYHTQLSKNGKTNNYYIHRIIAETFIPNPNNLPCVNHKDENKFNNCVWNLEWCTYSYNNTYGTKVDRIKATNKIRKNKCAEKPVIQLTKNGEFVNRYESGIDASRKTGIPCSNINAVCTNKPHHNTAGGFIWKYA